MCILINVQLTPLSFLSAPISNNIFMLQSIAYVQKTINMILFSSYFLPFYYMGSNGNNTNIQIILDSLQYDHLPIANTLTLWT